MIELKPCPFCGGKVKQYMNMFACSKCGYELIYNDRKFYSEKYPRSRDSHDAMAEAWNRRCLDCLSEEMYGEHACRHCGGARGEELCT